LLLLLGCWPSVPGYWPPAPGCCCPRRPRPRSPPPPPRQARPAPRTPQPLPQGDGELRGRVMLALTICGCYGTRDRRGGFT